MHPSARALGREQIEMAGYPTLLLVDDDPSTIRLLTAVLCVDYDILSVDSGAAALELLAERTVDAAVLDVMMPGMDGFELLDILRIDPATWDLPVIMLTALDDPQHKQRARELGVDAYLTKPFEVDLLEATLHLVVGSAPRPRRKAG